MPRLDDLFDLFLADQIVARNAEVFAGLGQNLVRRDLPVADVPVILQRLFDKIDRRRLFRQLGQEDHLF